MKKKVSLKWKIMSIFMSIIILLVSIITIFVSFATKELTEALSIKLADRISEEISQGTDYYLMNYETIVKALATQEAMKTGNTSEIINLMKPFLEANDDIKSLYVGYEDGRMIDAVEMVIEDYDPRNYDWFKEGS